MTFYDKFKILMEFEGGLTDNINDRGGLTKYGISYQFVRGNREKIEKYLSVKIDDIAEFIRNLDEGQAIAIYYYFFYTASKADKIQDHIISYYVFDMAVNHGVNRSGKILQEAINLYFGKRVLAVDGVIGSKTLNTMYEIEKPYHLYLYLIERRSVYYANIVKRNYKQLTFIEGWIKRASEAILKPLKHQNKSNA